MDDLKEYKVLARKYRPKKFSDLVGQDLLVRILSSAIINDRLAHAYILTGVRGVGKTTTARLIAMSINCQQRSNDSCEPCGDCDSCKSTGIDSNLDVIEMDGASNTGVDDVREIIDNVKYKPIIGKYKIFIIDEVHMLSKNAFNALLKTLEEPPDHVKFIFATTEVKKIPITVLSRCQRFDLLRIENKTLTEYLHNVVKLENIEIDSEAIFLIVRSADGSIRDALSLLDQAITNQSVKINSKSIADMLGLAERTKIFDLLQKILSGNALDSLNQYKNLYDYGADVQMIFDELMNVVHFITQIKIDPEIINDVYIPELERKRGFELSSKLSLNNLNIIWQILYKGYQELQKGSHLFQHGEMLILRIIYLFDGSSPDDLIKKIDEKENKIKSDRVLTTDDNKIVQKNNILNFEKEDIKENEDNYNLKNDVVKNYRQFVDMFFTNKEGILHSKLYNDVALISFKEGNIVLNTEKISDKTFNRQVAKLISRWTGRIWNITSSSSNLGKTLYEEDIINQQKEIEMMKNNNQVQKILSEFSGSKIHSITQLTDVNTDTEILNTKIKKEK